jgi:hypothetical protein
MQEGVILDVEEVAFKVEEALFIKIHLIIKTIKCHKESLHPLMYVTDVVRKVRSKKKYIHHGNQISDQLK